MIRPFVLSLMVKEPYQEQMWKIHTEFSNANLNVDKVLKAYSHDEIIDKLFATACYPEQGFYEAILEN